MTSQPPSIILDKPQMGENIGAVARAMANFGLSDLRLVNPRDGWPQERAWVTASGAEWPLNAARVFESVEAAISDLHLVYATTARPRELQTPILTPRQACAELVREVAAGRQVGLLFGGERAGLETADIALCQSVMTLPIDPKFRSLNLAQAVIILAYEWRMSLTAGVPPAFRDAPPPAETAAMLGLYEHFETELDAAGFSTRRKKALYGAEPPRRPGQARFSDQEVRTFRGVVTALSKGRGRMLEKLVKKTVQGSHK